MLLFELRPFLKIMILLADSETIVWLSFTSKMSGMLSYDIFEVSLNRKEISIIPVSASLLNI